MTIFLQQTNNRGVSDIDQVWRPLLRANICSVLGISHYAVQLVQLRMAGMFAQQKYFPHVQF